MVRANPHYSKLVASYLFSTVSRKVQEFQAANPGAKIIRMGIGDVTKPLIPSVIQAFHEGVDEMALQQTFRGYGPEQGYEFLRELIALNDFQNRGCAIGADEIFVSDGAKSDTANFQELFSSDVTIAVPDPVYPVYVDTNVMGGRTGPLIDGRYGKIIYVEGNEANGFVPLPPSEHADLAYLCFPNNPTGAVATREDLQKWVAWAKKNEAIILFDAAYEAFIRNDSLPRSIYEIPGAKDVAVEFRSLSKTAGFTGTRLGYTVVPKNIEVLDAEGKPVSLHGLWNRRQTTKFNGVSYPVQKAASAVFSGAGQKEIRAINDYYLENARLIRSGFQDMGFACTGGVDSPYIWIRCERDSWEFFDFLLEKAHVVSTPGSGFGTCGQGYIRLSAFNERSKVEEALQRVTRVLGK